MGHRSTIELEDRDVITVEAATSPALDDTDDILTPADTSRGGLIRWWMWRRIIALAFAIAPRTPLREAVREAWDTSGETH